MKKLIIFLLLYALSITAHAISENCTQLNNTDWQSDEFDAEVNAGYFHCWYKGWVHFNTNDNNITASMRFTKIKGGSLCDDGMNYELSGTCGIEKIEPIRMHDNNTHWEGFWNQEYRIGMKGHIPVMDGKMNALLSVYFVP